MDIFKVFELFFDLKKLKKLPLRWKLIVIGVIFILLFFITKFYNFWHNYEIKSKIYLGIWDGRKSVIWLDKDGVSISYFDEIQKGHPVQLKLQKFLLLFQKIQILSLFLGKIGIGRELILQKMNTTLIGINQL